MTSAILVQPPTIPPALTCLSILEPSPFLFISFCWPWPQRLLPTDGLIGRVNLSGQLCVTNHWTKAATKERLTLHGHSARTHPPVLSMFVSILSRTIEVRHYSAAISFSVKNPTKRRAVERKKERKWISPDRNGAIF